MRIADLETPVPVVDLDVLEGNLTKMQTYCNDHGLRLRPHIKTHKCPEIAQMQIDRGAVGITCQKLTEAEVMADAGFLDLLLSYPLVGVGKTARLAALAQRANVAVSVDSEQTLETAAEAAAISGSRISVWIDFDSGAGRTGVPSVEDALRLANCVLDTLGLEFAGLITYPLSPEAGAIYEQAATLFAREGVAIPGFSGAGTPTSLTSHQTHGLTEVRHGTYVFHDRSTVGAGAATLDECALHIWATVVSRPSRDRAILDSGSKSLSSDRVPETVGQGHGLIGEYPDAVIERLYEEHAIVRVPEGSEGLEIGERVRVLPNHVCVAVNLHDSLVGVRGDTVERRLQILGRGKTQ